MSKVKAPFGPQRRPAPKPTTAHTGQQQERGPRPPSGYSAANSNTRINMPRPFSLVGAKAGLPDPQLTLNMGLNSERQRSVMVSRLREQGITEERVLAAMQAVPRHAFVDQGLASRAYEDAALPIGYGQTISQPWVVAYMLSVICRDRQPVRVLEVGAGCGYQAAVLAHFVREVYAIERVRGLYEQARDNLARAGSRGRVRLSFGDGMVGLPHAVPFDGIVVSAAGVKIPESLLDQLAIGARLIAPEGTVNQKLILIERVGVASWRRSELENVRFVPLRPGTQN